MKKMNLKFFGLGAKIVLPLFLLVGLFMFSVNTASAQYLPKDEAMVVLKQHVDQLPNVAVSLNNGPNVTLITEDQAARNIAAFRLTFGKVLIHFIGKENMEVSEAIEEAVSMSEQRQIPEEALDTVKQEYVDLLQS